MKKMILPFLLSTTLMVLGLNAGLPAARVGDSSAHGGVIVGPGVRTVICNGLPMAVVTDIHTCPVITPGVPPVPHVGGPIINGSATVLIGGRPAARVGSSATCVGPPDTISQGSPTVLIGD